MNNLIKINEHSKTPKYRQIINSVIKGIENEELKLKDRLPSVNKLLIHFDISRDTVVKAYDCLKEMNVIESVPGKGYYVKNTNFKRKLRVFLLFNKLSPHKKIIYDSFVETLDDKATIDFFIYNNNYRLFKDLLLANKEENYTHFVIIAHFLGGGKTEAVELINQIPKHKLLLLDKKIEGVDGKYAAVYQDFEKDIYTALVEALDWLKKYACLKIIFPSYGYHPKAIIRGFKTFCAEYAFDCKIVKEINSEPIQKDEAYINLREDDLVSLIKRIKHMDLKLGKDVGLLSYNETPIKEILMDGITVISTDFEKLGKTAAHLILENKKEHIANPFNLVVRNSL
ncbi:MAG TPA: GntR family transcriptional regulator [Saprospiraceae bacterium]|nr:GntR family transcriptional regulator [Saprospiraceae bacterium]